MKLLVFNKKLKAYDILDVFEEKIHDFIRQVRSEGLFCRKISNERKVKEIFEKRGYEREKYY